MPASSEFQTLSMLRDAMNGALKRQQAFSDNMANVNTPGYKRKEVHFERQLKKAYTNREPRHPLHQAHPKHMKHDEPGPVQPTVHRVSDTTLRNDENNVDPDRQMAKLAKNSLYYSGLTQMARHEFQLLNQLMNNLR